MKRKQSRLIAAAVALVLAIGGITCGVSFYERSAERKRAEALGTQAGKTSGWNEENTVLIGDSFYGFDHRIETYLFVGTDASGNEEGIPGAASEDERYRGAMADFLLLLVMDQTDDTYGYIQIDRNAVTDVDELDEDGTVINTRLQQICTAHWYGLSPEMAAENTEHSVQNLLGQLDHIDGYFVLNMDDIGLLNHEAGGVEVTIEEDMTAEDPAFVKGATLTLSDEQANSFIRARMNVGSGDNASRMNRQKQYMDSFFKKVKERVREHPNYADEFWNALKDVADTDMNGNSFSRISQMLLRGESKGILALEGQHEIGQLLGDNLDHEQFIASDSSILQVMTELFVLEPVDDEDVADSD